MNKLHRTISAFCVALVITASTTGSATAAEPSNDYVAQQVSMMLASKTSITTLEQRKQLAEDIIRQTENPLSINQGSHNTCALAAIESRTYTLYPQIAADLIRQVATTGTYVSVKGDKIRIDPSNILPDAESQSHGYGQRSYASQLFQITAANVYWQTQRQDPRGIECEAGSIRFIQKSPSLVLSHDTGERLQILWKDGTVETVVDDSGRPVMEPCISLAEVQSIGTTIAAKSNETFVIAGRKFDRKQKFMAVKSLADLRSKLTQCQTAARMPLVAAVDLDHGWTTVENKKNWHAVCITSFNPDQDTVSIDNFWGPHADRVGDKSISLSELYTAISAE